MKAPIFTFIVKHKILSVIIITGIVSGWYYFNSQSWNDVNLWLETFAQTNQIEVTTGWLENSIFVIWEASLEDEQSLSFNKAWSITQVFFNVWDWVKKWDVIAQIDAYASKHIHIKDWLIT